MIKSLPNVEVIKYTDGSIMWHLNYRLHREDGPAIEYVDGSKEWHVNGKRHRTDGPAIITEVRKEWWKNNHRHREDGPTIEYANGKREWWLSDKKYSLDEFIKVTPYLKTDQERLAFYLVWK